MPVHNYVDQTGSTPILVAKRSAGVTPEVNQRILLHAGEKASKQANLLCLRKLGQILPEVQKSDINSPTKND